jgi:ankyrin repeat protein
VEQLLAAGAAVDTAAPGAEWTALMEAALLGHASIVEVLLAAGADVNADYEWTALLQAAGRAHPAAVELLLAHPNIYPAVVAAAEANIGLSAQDGGGEQGTAAVHQLFASWHLAQNAG